MTGSVPFDTSKSYFASVAESYDRLQPVIAGPAYWAGLAFMAGLVPCDEHDAFTCVELGCGTAAVTQEVLSRFPRANAVAIDGEPAMLAMARRKLGPYGGRAELRQADASTCDIPKCDVVLSSFMFHHLPPHRLADTLGRIAHALSPGGCLIVLDTMRVGPRWGEQIGDASGRLHRKHVAAAVAAGRATQEEIDARWAFKRKMKAEGKDVEHRHRVEDILGAMCEAGFDEVGLVWQQFAATILLGFVPQPSKT